MIAAQQQQQVQCGYYAGFTQVSSYPPAPSELPAPPESTCYLVEETWYSPNAPSPVGHPCDYPPPPGHYTWYRDWDIHPQGTGVWRDIYHCPQYQGPPAVGMQSGGMQYQVPGLPDWQQP